MPSLKTNFIRTQITSQCYRYEFQLLSNSNVDPKYFTELQGYFLSMNQLIVFSYPFVYSIQEMKQLKSFNFMLSNGQKVHVNVIVQNTITLNSKQVAEDIHRQIMKGTNFLYSEGLNICLNPFEERKINFTTSLMPGFSISTQVVNNVIGFYLIPLETKITQFHSLSSLHEHSIILDYDSGNFYQKSAIVRYDKQNEIVHFRTGQKLSKNSLKALQIMPLSGYDLAMRLSSYYKRIRQVDRLKKFIEKWEIKFESRFMELPYNFFPVSHILLGNKQEKSLGQTLGSISAFNFQYNFRKLFINSTFDDQLRANIIFLMPNIVVGQSSGNEQPIEVQGQEMTFYSQLVVEQEEFLLPIISEIENLKQRMSLNDCKVNVVKYNFYCGWANGMKRTLKELNQIVSTEKSNTNCDKIFVLTDLQDALRQQKQLQLGNNFILPQDYSQSLYRQIIQSLIQSNTYTHVVKAKQNEFRKYPDIIALKTTATIMTKLRLNPWKIKDIPFGTKPLVAISLSTKLQTSGSILVCGVGSLNAFLSKYTAHYARCTLETYAQTILRVMDEIMTKFKSIHKGFPKRAMIFRTGDFTSDCDGQFSSVQSKFTQLYQCKATYIILSSEFPLRVYNQIDLNYISKDTVKPTQLLCQVRYNNQRFIQLEADSPFYRVNILGIDQQEVSFEEKVIELTTKLCFSQQLMTEMRFGKGLGFVGYAEKFSQWIREYNNVSPMDQTLKDGVIVFL